MPKPRTPTSCRKLAKVFSVLWFFWVTWLGMKQLSSPLFLAVLLSMPFVSELVWTHFAVCCQSGVLVESALGALMVPMFGINWHVSGALVYVCVYTGALLACLHMRRLNFSSVSLTPVKFCGILKSKTRRNKACKQEDKLIHSQLLYIHQLQLFPFLLQHW